jgi:hypothetical protein
MNTLPFTIVLLMLLAILSLSALRQTVDRELTAATLSEHLTASRTLDSTFQNAFYQLKIQESLRSTSFPKEKSSTTSDKATTTTTRQRRPLPEFPSRLNLDALLEPGDSARKQLYCTTLVKLLDILYPDQRTLNQSIVDQLIQKLPDSNATLSEHLATLYLDDLHPQWVRMLRTSLLKYLTFGEHAINLAYAAPPLLLALFEDPAIADAIIARRDQLIRTYNTETTTTAAAASQNEKSAQLETFVQQLLSSRPDLLDTYRSEFSYRLYYRPSELSFTSPDRLHLRRHHAIKTA